MVRRTKEEALATRAQLLDSAEILFQKQGVARTSLHDIAAHAGVTRGAIYWHFQDKADLFNAMMERVTLPLEQSFEAVAQDGGGPLEIVRQGLLEALRRIANDPQTRRVIEVATQKVEYVDELQAVRLRHRTVRDSFVARVEKGLRLQSQLQRHALPVDALTAAHGLHGMVDGLIQNWLLAPEEFNLLSVGRAAIDIYLAGLGFEAAGAAVEDGVRVPIHEFPRRRE
jgi:TetR/AcrR family acrAB operon transcriptional repressor